MKQNNLQKTGRQRDLHVGAIFIAFNAESTLPWFYKNFPKQLVESIILVDDASKDKTFEIAQALGIQSYKNPVNLGYGGNLKRALTIAKEEGMNVIVDIHPDGEYDPSAIPAALEQVRDGADFVLGNRFTKITDQLKTGMYFWKFIPIVVLNFLARFVLRTKINDFHQGFRVYTTDMLDRLNYSANSNGYLFSFEIIAQAVRAGMDIRQVPVQTRYTGKKRGATLKHSVVYSFGVLKVLAKYLLDKVGVPMKMYKVMEPEPAFLKPWTPDDEVVAPPADKAA